MFIFQVFYYLFRPQDKSRLWYLILLFLFQFYNISGGLFPDPRIQISIATQEMIAYGSGFLMASYFPFYFYMAFDLKSLRWHALFGVPLFLMLPYLIFFVIVYAINHELNVDVRFGMIAPLIYAMVLIWVMYRGIRKKFIENRDKNKYIEEIAMYFAVVPWASLTFFGVVEESQLLEVLVTNTGIVVITILFIRKSIRNARFEYQLLQNINVNRDQTEEFQQNCERYGLTKTEIQVVEMLYQGLANKEIADKMFISKETVKKHIYNIFRKADVKNRSSLIHILLKRCL
jgi:DNA-binding CsgD family transcriptional regulator